MEWNYCPECGKIVEGKVLKCSHCGCFLVNTKCDILGQEYDFSKELPVALLGNDKYIHAVVEIKRKTSMTVNDAVKLVRIIRVKREIPKEFIPEEPLEDRELLYGNQQEKCPFCGSCDVTYVDALTRTAMTFLWRRDSQKFYNDRKCCNCGMTWQMITK